MAQSAAHKHDSARRATYQDVLDAPAHLVAEIIDGTLYTHPRPAMPHARAASVLGGKIGTPFDVPSPEVVGSNPIAASITDDLRSD